MIIAGNSMGVCVGETPVVELEWAWRARPRDAFAAGVVSALPAPVLARALAGGTLAFTLCTGLAERLYRTTDDLSFPFPRGCKVTISDDLGPNVVELRIDDGAASGSPPAIPEGPRLAAILVVP